MKVNLQSFGFGFAAAALLLVSIYAVMLYSSGIDRAPSLERVFTPDELLLDGWIFSTKNPDADWRQWPESLQGKRVRASVIVRRDSAKRIGAVTRMEYTAGGHKLQHLFRFSPDTSDAQSLKTGDVIDLQGWILHIKRVCNPDGDPSGATIFLHDPRWERRER